MIPQSWRDEAIESAKQRRDFHAQRGSRRHWNDPSKGEYGDEFWGSLAQIVFREYLEEAAIPAEFSALFTDDLTTLPPWDFKILNPEVCGDVKAIPPDSDGKRRVRLLVKASEFKRLDVYVAVKFHSQDDYSLAGWTTGEELANIPPKSFGFQPAHWKMLTDLNPIDDFQNSLLCLS